MDVIRLQGVRALGRHGADPGERDAPQPFEVDVVLEIDLSAAEHSDRLPDTIDYRALRDMVVTTIETTSFCLLERLCGAIMANVLDDVRIARAEVTIGKPRALADAAARVSLRRENPRRG